MKTTNQNNVVFYEWDFRKQNNMCDSLTFQLSSNNTEIGSLSRQINDLNSYSSIRDAISTIQKESNNMLTKLIEESKTATDANGVLAVTTCNVKQFLTKFNPSC